MWKVAPVRLASRRSARFPVDFGEAGVAQVGAAEVGGRQARAGEVGAAEVGFVESGVKQRNIVELCVGQVGFGERGAVEAHRAEVER